MDQNKLNLAFQAFQNKAITQEELARIAHSEGLINTQELNRVIIPKENGIQEENPLGYAAIPGKLAIGGAKNLSKEMGIPQDNKLTRLAELIPSTELGVGLQAILGGGLAPFRGPVPKGLVSNPETAKGLGELMQGTSGIPAYKGQRLLQKTGEVLAAKSMPEAQAAYGEAVGGLKGGPDFLREFLNKTIVKNGDYERYVNYANNLVNKLSGPFAATELMPELPQEVLAARQAGSKLIRQLPGSVDKKGLIDAVNKMDDFLNKVGDFKSPMAETNNMYANAATKDAFFNNVMPQRKYLGPDALRIMFALMNASHGNPAGLGLAAAESPMALGNGISALFAAKKLPYQATQNPVMETALRGSLNYYSRDRNGQ